MSTLISASVNLSKIDKSKLIDGKKGKYLDLTIWVNDEDDQFGNNVSVQQKLSKEEREGGAEKIYLGNGKTFAVGGEKATTTTESTSDLPF